MNTNNNKPTSIFVKRALKALAKYKGKNVTLLFSGGVNSTLMALALKEVGVKRLNLVHISLGREVHDNFAMELISARNVADTLGMELKVGKLSGVPKDVRNDPTYKHAIISQIAPMFVHADDDFCLMALGASTTGAGLIKNLQRTYRASAYFDTDQDGAHRSKLEFPFIATKRNSTIHAIKDMVTNADSEAMLYQVSNCNNLYGTLLLNGVHTNCGQCLGCRSMGTKLDDFGPSQKLIAEATLGSLNALYPGGQKVIPVRVAEKRVDVVVINANNTFSHRILSVKLEDCVEAELDATDFFVGELSDKMIPVPEDYQHTKYATMSIYEVSKGYASKLADWARGLVSLKRTELTDESVAEVVKESGNNGHGGTVMVSINDHEKLERDDNVVIGQGTAKGANVERSSQTNVQVDKPTIYVEGLSKFLKEESIKLVDPKEAPKPRGQQMAMLGNRKVALLDIYNSVAA